MLWCNIDHDAIVMQHDAMLMKCGAMCKSPTWYCCKIFSSYPSWKGEVDPSSETDTSVPVWAVQRGGGRPLHPLMWEAHLPLVWLEPNPLSSSLPLPRGVSTGATTKIARHGSMASLQSIGSVPHSACVAISPHSHSVCGTVPHHSVCGDLLKHRTDRGGRWLVRLCHVRAEAGRSNSISGRTMAIVFSQNSPR